MGRPPQAECYHSPGFGRDDWRGAGSDPHEKSVSARRSWRSDVANRQASAGSPAAVGQNGRRPDDGALFGGARSRFRPAGAAARPPGPADRTVRPAYIQQRKTVSPKQPHGRETCILRWARFSSRTRATQSSHSAISPGRGSAMHKAPASLLRRTHAARVGHGDVQTPRPSPASIWSVIRYET